MGNLNPLEDAGSLQFALVMELTTCLTEERFNGSVTPTQVMPLMARNLLTDWKEQRTHILTPTTRVALTTQDAQMA